MLLRDYFIKALKTDVHKYRSWITTLFSIPFKDIKAAMPWMLSFHDGQYYVLKEDGEEELIETGYDYNQRPLMLPLDLVHLEPGDLENVYAPVDTCYGNAITNFYMFVYPFVYADINESTFARITEKVRREVIDSVTLLRRQRQAEGRLCPIPYQSGTINGKRINVLLEDTLRAEKMTVSEFFDVQRGLDMLTPLTMLIMTTATPKALELDPAIIAERDRLLELYKDRLTDPAIAALIDAKMVEMLKERLKDDPVAKYYIKEKSYTTVLKKLYATQGGLPSMDDPTKVDYIPSSLREGLRPEDMPAGINSARSGSYDRGASTADGGAAVNSTNRTGMNTDIVEDFCGTGAGVKLVVNRFNTDKLIGRTILGETAIVDEARANSLIHKQVYIYGPPTCNTVNGNYCKRCMNEDVVNSNVKLGSQLAAIDSVFLKIFLAAFHARELKTVRYEFEEQLL